MKTRRAGVVIAAAGCGIAVMLAGCGKPARAPQVKKPPAEGMHAEAGPQTICEDDLNDIFFISPVTLPPVAVALASESDWAEKERGTGFAVGAANTILKTTDGGVTWRRVLERQAGGPEFASIQFMSPTEGWAVSRDVLLHTDDAGESWSAAAKPQGSFTAFGPSVATAFFYYQMEATGTGATIFRTGDGGQTWAPLPGQLPRNDYEAMFFIEDTDGWVAGSFGRIAWTADGGQTWRQHMIPSGGYLTRLQFVDPLRGWAMPRQGHAGGIWSTDDGGRSWRRQPAGVRQYYSIQDMQFLDESTGFLLVDMGTDGCQILRTFDGGSRWSVGARYEGNLRALCFVSPEEGWLVGAKGVALHYRP